LIILAFVLSNLSMSSAQVDTSTSKINWMTWEQAVTACLINPKPVVVYFYTESCPECSKMDSVAFQDTIAHFYLNNEYYAVKMDAQLRDTIIYKRRYLVYREYKDLNAGYHDLAAGMLEHNFSFPAFVVFNRNLERLRNVNGYFNATLFNNFLDYYSRSEERRVGRECC